MLLNTVKEMEVEGEQTLKRLFFKLPT